RAMRLGRWPRSLALFVGSAAFFYLYREVLFATDITWVVLQSLLAFLLTWAISTANYIINEIVDAPYDVHHPTKRNRPLVMGEIKKIPFLFMAVVISATSLYLAYLQSCPPFFYSLLALLVAGFIYNIKPIRTKDIPFLDSISESANNPIRFLIGWFAFASPEIWPPLSILLCWWAFGNFLMIAKRLSEFRLLKERAGDYRNSLRRYSEGALMFGMAASAVIFFLAYIYFALTFKLETLLLFSPFVFFYFFLFFRKTMREDEVMEEPERLFMHLKFALYTLFLIAIFFLSSFLDKPLH
ncbi:MAG: UbiA family prenyltransferase, partial [Candidatus Aminicenantaceae bacterium]